MNLRRVEVGGWSRWADGVDGVEVDEGKTCGRGEVVVVTLAA